jgi:hypothetical protein
VVDKEVDGDSSLPARMEANPSRRISQARAATRAARSVFLCSAPLVGQPNAGLTGPGLRLACAEPGDQLAIFGEALRELTERATYLYEEAGRYWFSTQPTLNRVADDRAKAYPDQDVDDAIAQVLREDAAGKDRFSRVFAVPDDPIAIDEAQSLSLVILGPAMPHGGKGVTKSAATDAVTETLLRCRASQRQFRNMLLFVAADEAQLVGAREAMRRAMAWRSIVDDDRLQQQMTQAQSADARDKAKTGRDGAVKAVRLAWSHILYPIKTEATAAGTAFDLEHLGISSRDRGALPAAVYDKAKADGVAVEILRSESFRKHIDPLWPEGRPHLPVFKLAEWFAAYVYLPKLRDRVVLEGAIRDAVGKLDAAFAYADSFDMGTGSYQGLLWAQNPPEIMPSTALLVRADVAKEQLRPAEKPPVEGRAMGASADHPTGDGLGNDVATTKPAPRQPTRFYGSVEIDMVRPMKSFDAIVNAVVMELQRTHGAKVKLTLEIEAEAAAGFAEADIGVVRDNACHLKFKPDSTGFDG